MSILPTKWSEVCAGPSVILGLKRYAFRRTYSGYKLQKLGYTNLEYVDAFDGFENDVDVALNELGIQFHTGLGKGHKGCCYSHVVLWQRMVAESIPYMTIFEDDCLGHLELANGLGQKVWDTTPKEFDIVYLGNMMNPTDPLLESPSEKVVQVPSYCLHAYILTLAGAKRLLSLAKEMNSLGHPLAMLDVQLVQWQVAKQLNWYCWNGTHVQKSYPTFDEGLPWQAFSDVITPQKDTGLFWQNMRLGTTLEHPSLQLTMPQYSR